jgi:hypothetical protein
MGTGRARASGAATIRQKLPERDVRSRSSTRRPAGWRVGVACAATLLAAACSRPIEASDLAPVELDISPEPARVGPATITLELGGAAGKPIIGARVAIEADMSHPGMSPLFAGAKEAESGRCRACLAFQMAGVWVILLQVTLPGAKKRERQIDVRGVRPN